MAPPQPTPQGPPRASGKFSFGGSPQWGNTAGGLAPGASKPGELQDLYVNHAKAQARCQAGDPAACGMAKMLEARIQDAEQRQQRQKSIEENMMGNIMQRSPIAQS